MQAPKSHRTRIGLLVTAGYLLTIAEGALLYGTVEGMTLNTWGDFLAGVFAPLAFLWLVIGYFQQGDELQQNTDALKQQAESLRDSVREQERLAESTQQQVELSREASTQQINLVRLDKQPAPWLLEATYIGGVGSHRMLKVEILNRGARALSVLAYIDLPNSPGFLAAAHRFDLWDEHVPLQVVLPVKDQEGEKSAEIVIRYIDGLGEEQHIRYGLSCIDPRHWSGWVLDGSVIKGLKAYDD